MEHIIQIIGFTILWAATDIGRKPESKIKFGSKKWFIMFALLVIGCALVSGVGVDLLLSLNN